MAPWEQQKTQAKGPCRLHWAVRAPDPSLGEPQGSGSFPQLFLPHETEQKPELGAEHEEGRGRGQGRARLIDAERP